MGSAWMVSPAVAQEDVTTVVVTGSRIPTTGIYASSPVTAVGQQELKFEGTTNVENLLNNLPSVFADFGQGDSNGATGTATVNLRGLGNQRTLVLVDGRRLMPGDPFSPVADLNNIPSAMVDHVEVLTGGASAVYGSDAIAGVVNFIMRKDFEGVELDGQYTINNADNGSPYFDGLNTAIGFPTAPTNTWDGRTVDATFIAGVNTNDGKGNITGYLSYRNVQPVLESERDFSACTLQSNKAATKLACAGSSNYNRWISIDNASPRAAHAAYSSLAYDFFQNGNGTPGSGTFVPFTAAQNQVFNFAPFNYLKRPDERYTGGFSGHYEITPAAIVYADFMFADDHTNAQIAPSGLFLGSGNVSGFAVTTNCDNPLMTAQENQQLCGKILPGQAYTNQFLTDGSNDPCFGGTFFTCFGAAGPYGNGYDTFNGTNWDGAGNIVSGASFLEIGRRNIEGGARNADLRHTSYRMSVGLKGDLGGGWAYDVYAQYGTMIYSQVFSNELSVQRVQNAMNVDPVSGQCTVTVLGVDPSCVPLDVFNGLGSITPAMLGYVGAQGFMSGQLSEHIVSGSITGDLGEWGIQSPWAKSPVGLALGAEYRQETIELKTSRDFQLNDLYGSGGATLPVPKSGFNVVEGFGEIRIPIIEGQPFFQSLMFTGGYRYSSYSLAGNVNSYKYGLEWQPIDDFKLRGSFNRATRAPNVVELFTPQNIVLFGGQDPCAQGQPGAGTSLCAGVPNQGGGLLLCPSAQCNQQVAGNASLAPETSDTKTYGIVLTPTFLDGFTATVDYFDIKVDKFIGTAGAPTTLRYCYDPAFATPTTIAFLCPLVNRNSLGQIYGSGFVNNENLNTGFLATKGWDFEANYNTDFADWGMGDNGSLSFNFVGTLIKSLQVNPLPGLPVTECKGLYGPTLCGTPVPEWRHKLRVTWTSPWDTDLSLAWRHISGVKEEDHPTSSLLELGAVDYIDVSGDWTIREGVEIRAGVQNIFDKSPPVTDSNLFGSSSPPFGNANTFPNVYDALGRTIFIGGTIKY